MLGWRAGETGRCHILNSDRAAMLPMAATITGAGAGAHQFITQAVGWLLAGLPGTAESRLILEAASWLLVARVEAKSPSRRSLAEQPGGDMAFPLPQRPAASALRAETPHAVWLALLRSPDTLTDVSNRLRINQIVMS